jgi:glycine cleavage system aminomethyltransferase T
MTQSNAQKCYPATPINEDAFLLFRAGPVLRPYEYTGWRDETLSWKNTAYLGTMLMHSPIFVVKGPDAAKFLSDVCINNFSKFSVGRIRHAVMCNEKGQIMTDGVVMKTAEDEYYTYWLQPVIEYRLQKGNYNVEGKDISGQEYFFQIAGPRSLEILEKAGDCDLHDIKFAQHRLAKIAGKDVRILRLGMTGTLAYEVHGPIEDCNDVYNCIWEAGQEFGMRKLGQVAYCMNHTESGFPNIHMHYPLPWYEDPDMAKFLNERPGMGWFNENRILVGSVGDDLESRFLTPFDVGWENLVKFDHDFIGRAALENIAKKPKNTVVTLEWNVDDIMEVYGSQFRGGDVEPFDYIEDRPADIYYNVTNYVYHADKVLVDGKQIGISSVRAVSQFYRRMISLGFIEREYAEIGREVVVLWGTPGHPQKEIRAKVERFPYLQEVRSEHTNVANIPQVNAER